MVRATGLWAEAWTVPGTGVGLVTKKVPFIRVTESEWLDPVAEAGRGSLSLPAIDEDIPLILDPENDVFSMIRIRRPSGSFGGAHVYSWLTRRFEDRESDREVDLANLTGAGIEEILRVNLLPYDFPRVDAKGRSYDPDWEWGSDDNRVRNPGLEEPGTSIENPSFETGVTFPWQAGAVDGVSATASVLTDGGHTGPNYMRIIPLLAEGGGSTTVDTLPNADYNWVGWVRVDIGKRYQVGASGPEGLRALAPATAVVEGYPGYEQGFEAHYDFLGTGVFQLFSLTFRTAPDQTSTSFSIRDLTDPEDLQPIDLDDVGYSGLGVGMAPWVPTHADPNIVSTFEVSQLVTPFEGLYHGHIVAEQYGGGKQTVAGVNPGERWTYIARLQGLVAGHEWGIEVKDRTGRIIAQQTMALTGPGTWDELVLPVDVPVGLPGGQGNTDVEIWIVNHHDGVSTVYFDGVEFYHGLPAATYGEIMHVLLEDLAVTHSPPSMGAFEALTFIKRDSWDAVNDSDGNPWTTTHSYKAEIGKTILEVAGDFAQKGLEFEVIDLDGTDLVFDVELKIYEVEGVGVDLSADSSVALVAGTNVLPTEIIRAAPVANDITVQGADRIVVRVEDAVSIAATGRIGAYISAPELTSLASVTGRANSELTSRIVPVSLRPTIIESPNHTTPYYDFNKGDKVTCIFPPRVPVQGRRVVSIAGRWSGREDYAIFDVDTDRRVFASNPLLGLTRAVDILWRKFSGRVRVPTPQVTEDVLKGITGDPTICVAPYNASPDSKAIAHFQLPGGSDNAVLDQAQDALVLIGTGASFLDGGRGGRLVILEGDVEITGTYAFSRGFGKASYPVRVHGLGKGITNLWIMTEPTGSQVAITFTDFHDDMTIMEGWVDV